MNTKQFLKGQVKASKDSNSFSVIASTATIDRQGESIDQSGWDLANYKNNPIILWAHDYSALPIGVAEEVSVTEEGLTMSGRFASEEANPMAENVRKLYSEGILKTVSVGFIPKERNGNIITKAELLEVSFVPVPANPQALSLAMTKGLQVDTALVELIEKCAEVDVTEPVVEQEATPEGDTATTETQEGENVEVPNTDTEVKSGRVLSTKNRDLISSSIQTMKTSIASLEELLNATEPAERQSNMDTTSVKVDHVERSESKKGFVEIQEETLKELLTHARQAREKNEVASAVLKRLLKK